MKDIVSELIAHAELHGCRGQYINDARYMSDVLHGMDVQQEDIIFLIDFPRTSGDIEVGTTQSLNRSFTFFVGRKSELETDSSIGEAPLSKWTNRLAELSEIGALLLQTFFTGCNTSYTLKSWQNDDQINESSTSIDFVSFNVTITEWMA